MSRVQHAGKLSRLFGAALSMHSNTHLGVSLMAMAHMAAATKNLTFACDTYCPWQIADEIVEGGRLSFADGAMPIGDKGGLGVDLDYYQIVRLKERFAKIPYRRLDDEGEMRKHLDRT